jgi:BlaI family transcriptional regulator, penicillinase repressor
VMTRKKYLRRSMRGKSCLFEPRWSREDASRRMLHDVVRRVFDGSAKAAVLSLFDSAELDPSELKELRQLIDQKDQGTVK